MTSLRVSNSNPTLLSLHPVAISRRPWWPGSLGGLLLFAVAAVAFGWTAHRGSWEGWRWISLVAISAGLSIAWFATDVPVRTVFGTPQNSHRGRLILSVAGLAVLAAVGYRCLIQTPPLPGAWQWVAWTAMAIGMTEEILWRGAMQGELTKAISGRWAVLVTAASHTAYKTALFLAPPAAVAQLPVGGLALAALLTFSFGSLLGWLRQREGTIAAPVAFHLVFDLIVYGDRTTVLWWVW